MKLRKDKKKRLTKKQSRFVDAYLSDPNLNATQAALQAGYSKSSAYLSGYQNLNDSKTVQDEIEERMKQRAKEVKITEADVLRKLKRVQRITFKKGNYASSIRALELLGRHIGMWPQNGTNVGINLEIDLTEQDKESMEVMQKLQTIVDRVEAKYEDGWSKNNKMIEYKPKKNNIKPKKKKKRRSIKSYKSSNEEQREKDGYRGEKGVHKASFATWQLPDAIDDDDDDKRSPLLNL